MIELLLAAGAAGVTASVAAFLAGYAGAGRRTKICRHGDRCRAIANPLCSDGRCRLHCKANCQCEKDANL